MVGENVISEKATQGAKSSSEYKGPRHGAYIVAKNAIEWLAAVLLMIVVGPFVGMLALLIKSSSPGPAFYSQVRLGLNGRPYRIYKLRSMSHNCEAKTGAVWSSGNNDPRVTRLGRLLRDTHLDELPQLWNVIKGDMCLVGPRPERPEIASKLECALPSYKQRLWVKPGVTGLAQVQLPPDSDLEGVRRKLAYDLHYMREVSPILDARILVATFFQFSASAINAVGQALVKSEKASVEARNYGGLKIVANDSWRVGAA